MDNQKAINSYVASLTEIAGLLEDLKSFMVDDHMGISPEEVNWGHVGSAEHMLKLLNEAAAFVGIRPAE